MRRSSTSPSISASAVSRLAIGAAFAARLMAAATAAESRAPADAVLTLDAFDVSADRASRYGAGSSLTATGIGARIAETPLPIHIVTSELVADAVALELREALNFVPGVLTNPRSESTFVVRGFSGLVSYRNGHYRRQLFPTWNMDRVEVEKGASAVFFGAVRPGGVINTITVKPVPGTTFTQTKLVLGSEDFRRIEAYWNQSIRDNLAVRLGAGSLDAGSDRQFDYKRENYLGASVLWRPTPRQQITLDLETVRRRQFYVNSFGGRALSNSRFLFNPLAPAVNQQTTSADTATRNFLNSQGYAATPGAPNFSPTFDIFAPIHGPRDPSGASISLTSDARSAYESRTLDLEYLLEIGENLVWQTRVNTAFDDAAGLQPSGGDTRAYADGTLRIRFEDFVNIRHSRNLDNKLTWRFAFAGARHDVQFGQEFQKVVFTRPGYLDAANRYTDSPLGGAGPGPTYVTGYRPGIDAPLSAVAGMRASGQTFNITRWQPSIAEGYFIVDQARLGGERVVVLAGARYNRSSGSGNFSRPVSNSNLSASSPGGLASTETFGATRAWTPQLGALVKPRPDVSLFATYSESVEMDFGLDADGRESEPIESTSWDAGVKTELFGGRLASTLSCYAINRANLKYSDTARQNATGRAPYFLYGNAEGSAGIEADVNWSPAEKWQVLLGFSHFLRAETTRSNDPARVGAPLAYTPRNTVTLWTRHEFSSGALEGLVIGAGLRHNDAARISGDPQIVVENPAFTVFDVMLARAIRLLERDVRVQLNVKNLTDERYREGVDGFFGARRQILLGFETKF